MRDRPAAAQGGEEFIQVTAEMTEAGVSALVGLLGPEEANGASYETVAHACFDAMLSASGKRSAKHEGLSRPGSVSV